MARELLAGTEGDVGYLVESATAGGYMYRSLLKSLVIVLCLGAAALAVERATFILTNGERVSGLVVFHTDARTNIRADKQEFNVGVVDGREVPIPFNQVAVIDFVGGTPPTQELAGLADGRHTLSLKDGSVRQGRLVDLIGGDTVRWEDANGQKQDLPIREVNRVYLNAGSARTAFNYTPGPDRRDITAATPIAGDTNSVEVRADTPWNDTGLTVRRGDRVTFSATGKTAFLPGQGDTAGPEGNNKLRLPSYPVPNAPVGALIGKIGNGAPFLIGTNSQSIVMSDAGRLMLAVNDDHYPDNEGALKVSITRNGAR